MIAASLVIGAHLATQHFGSGASGMETITPGIYVRMDGGATFGAYRNSYGRGSVYAGRTFNTSDGRFSLTAGAVSGYPGQRVLPLLVPSMRIDIGDGFAARVAFLPKPPVVGLASGLHIAIEQSF